MNLCNKDVPRVIQEEPLKLCVGGSDSKHYFTPGSEPGSCLEPRLDWWVPCKEGGHPLHRPSHRVSFVQHVAIPLVGSPFAGSHAQSRGFPAEKLL